MYDIDRSKNTFISLLDEFIRETEHSLAYFFAILVFLLTFLLALFGKEALYTGLIGVLCLLLIKLRDIIEGFKELSHNNFFSYEKLNYIKPAYPQKAERSFHDLQNFYTAFDDAALSVMAKEFPARFNEQRHLQTLKDEKNNLLSYLQTCWKIIEKISLFFPDQPLQPETKKALNKMISTAQKYLLRYLEEKYSLTKEQISQIEKSLMNNSTDDFFFQTQLESFGIDEMTAQRTVKISVLLRKISFYLHQRDSFFSDSHKKDT